MDQRRHCTANRSHPQEKGYENRLAKAYLNNSCHSDISFYIPKDNRTIPAHSLIVAAASSMLERVCYGIIALEGSNTITLPDMYRTDEFMVVLRYIYQGGDLKDILKDQNIAIVCKLAVYFELKILKDNCLNIIMDTLTPDNVCHTFDLLHSLNVAPDFDELCIDLMKANMSQILANGTAMRMGDSSLEILLNAEMFNMKGEHEIAAAMLRWANDKCREQSLETNPVNLRQILESRLAMIRFTAMTLDEFQNVVKLLGPNMLTRPEVTKIVEYISSEEGMSKEDVKIGQNTVLSVRRKIGRIVKRCRSAKVGHASVACHSEMFETLEAPYSNRRVWLTGLKICDLNAPPFLIINVNTGKIIHRFQRGQSPSMRFAERVPLSQTTNGQWKLLFRKAENNVTDWSLLTRMVDRDGDDCLHRHQCQTCIESITYEYEEFQQL